MMNPAFRVAGLSIVLNEKKLLKEVSFEVAAGESLAIIGPNGAGKSTLLKALLRLVPLHAGHVEIFGRRQDKLSQRDVARLVSYVPQAEGGVLPFSVREFVLMARYPHISPFSPLTGSDYEAADAALTQTEMYSFADRGMNTLSGGERQKVYMAAAIAQNTPALLLDEPTTFLDYRHQVEILALMGRLHREKGLTMISVTHDLNQGALAGDRVLALREGEVAFYGTPAELLDHPDRLAAIYDTEFRLVPNPYTGAMMVVPAIVHP